VPLEEWQYYTIANSKHCPALLRDPYKLMYEMKLPRFLKLKQVVDILTAQEEAYQIDQENADKASKGS